MRDCGRSGIISYVPPGSALYAARPLIAVLFRATKVGGPSSPFRVGSGPAMQIGGTAFGPSQIPSSSVSGSNGSVPVSFASTYSPVSVSTASSKPSASSSVSATRPGVGPCAAS